MVVPSHLHSLLTSINLTLTSLSISLSLSSVALALPVPDATLGTQNTPLGPGAVQIDGGTTVGQNLFHSFDSFNIDTGEFVYFFSPADVNHIFSRVTGATPSEIDGVLGTIGSDADLFLMNPNGVMFGTNASLDVEGSFIVTTADAIEFAGAGSFGTAELDSELRLLTVNPSAFLFNPGTTGAIENRSQFYAGLTPNGLASVFGLRVPDGRDILFIGGNLLADQGGLISFGGDIGLGSVSETLTTEQRIGYQGSGASLVPAELRGNITYTNGSGLFVAGGGGGSVSLYGDNINITNNSFINAGFVSNLGFESSQAGDIYLDATEKVNIMGGMGLTTVFNFVAPNSSGTSGDVTIHANELSVVNGGQIGVLNRGDGKTGNVQIEALEKVEIDSRESNLFTGIFSRAFNPGNGSTGNINIETQNLLISGGARIDASNFGQGNTGNISISADTFDVIGRGNIFSINDNTGVFLDVDARATGNTGDLSIETRTLTLQEGGRLSATVFGQGNTGELRINAADQLLIDGQRGISRIENNISPFATGETNGLSIQADKLLLQNGAQIQSQLQGNGDIGEIEIATNLLTLQDRSQILSQLQGTGSTSGIIVSAEDLIIENGGRIDGSINLGRGNTGNIEVEANELIIRGISFRSSGIFLNNRSIESIGNDSETNVSVTGDIILDIENLTLSDGGELSASIILGRGDAGKIEIIATRQVLLDGSDNNSFIFNNIESGGVGTTSGIFINTEFLSVFDGSQIQSQIEGQGSQGSAGLINIRADKVIFSGSNDLPSGRFAPSAIFSRLRPNAQGSTEGIGLNIGSLLLTDGAQISSTTSGVGDSGNIKIIATGGIILSEASILSEVTAASEIDSGEEIGGGTVGGGGSIDPGGAGSTQQNIDINNSNSNDTRNAFGISNNGGTTLFSETSRESDITNTLEEVGGRGNGGDIVIIADMLKLNNGSSLLADTESRGNAGNIILDIRDTLKLSGEGPGGIARDFIVPSQISTTVDGENARGEGGFININSGSIQLTDSSFINSGTSGLGPAGDITIAVDNDLSLVDGRISVISESDYKAGDLSITANKIFLDRNSLLTATSATVNGGNILLNLNELLLMRNSSEITATGGTARAGGNGGNIIINAPFIVTVPSENSDITANAFSGSGGQVIITAEGIFGIEPRPNPTPLSDITASSALGVVGGAVTLNSPDTSFIQNSLTELPDTLVNPDTLVASSCVAHNQDTGSTFVITGNSLANTPNSTSPVYSTGTVQIPNINTAQSMSQAAIIEPAGIYQTTDGRLVMSKEC